MAQGDYNIQNQSFPSFRSDLNSTLEAINTSNSGTSRPTSAVAGTVWLDTTNATNPTLKLFDGSDDISLATFDYSANTVNWLDSTVSADLVNDLSPQLGGMLDVNGNAIGNGTEELIKFSETASAVNEITVTNSATGNAPEISATGSDTNIDFKLTPKGTGKLILDSLNFPTADGTNGQALITDGSGNLSFGDVAGGDMTPAFSAERSSTLTLNDNTFTDVIFDTEILDTDSAFNTSTGVFTVPTGKGGKYFIGINLMFGDNEGNASDWIGNLIINASSNYLIRYESTSNGNTFTQVTNSWSLILNLSAGDTLKVQGLCDTNDSSSGTLVGGNFKTSFMGYKIIE